MYTVRNPSSAILGKTVQVTVEASGHNTKVLNMTVRRGSL